jgi:hypothetical protein
LLLIHWMFKQFAAEFHISSRRPKGGSGRHSVQIVILDPVRCWPDGCKCREENVLEAPAIATLVVIALATNLVLPPILLPTFRHSRPAGSRALPEVMQV